MSTYRIWNNTDLREHPVLTTNRREAERVWRRVRPNRSAGNLYTATFASRCSACGGWQDETVEWETCDCCERTQP